MTNLGGLSSEKSAALTTAILERMNPGDARIVRDRIERLENAVGAYQGSLKAYAEMFIAERRQGEMRCQQE